MKLHTNLQSDITNLQSMPAQVQEGITVPEEVWDTFDQEFTPSAGMTYQSRRFRSIAWLDKSRLVAFRNDSQWRDNFTGADPSLPDDEYTEFLVAKQALLGLTAEQMQIDEATLITKAENRLKNFTSPDHTEVMEGLIMACNIRILQMEQQVSPELLDKWVGYLDRSMKSESKHSSFPYLTNCGVIMRVLWPEHFKSMDLKSVGLDKPLEALATASHADIYIIFAAKLRFIHADKIIYTPTGVEIIDNANRTSNGEDLPGQIVF